MKRIIVFCVAMLAMAVSSNAQEVADSLKCAQPEKKEAKAVTKWNVSVDLGAYTSFTKFPNSPYGIPDRDDALLADLSITYNVTPGFELGVAAGCFGPTAKNGINVPVMGVLAYRWYVGDDGRWQPFIRVRAGYAFTANGKGANTGIADIAPGVAFQFASWAAVRASLDVNSFFAQKDKSKAQFNFAPRIGVEFKF